MKYLKHISELLVPRPQRTKPKRPGKVNTTIKPSHSATTYEIRLSSFNNTTQADLIRTDQATESGT